MHAFSNGFFVTLGVLAGLAFAALAGLVALGALFLFVVSR